MNKHMNKIQNNILLNRYVLLWTCILFSLVSFYISVYCLKESNLNLFASSGAIMSLVGLILTIKETLIVFWTIPLEWAINVKKYGSGAFFASENTPKEKQETKELIKDQKYGINLMIFGTIIWAYSSYLPCFN